MNKKKQTRRDFIKKTTGAITGLTALPYFIPSSIIGRNNIVPPSDKIRIGCIGVGWQGTSNMRTFLKESDAVIVAVCDIDKNHLEEAKNTVNTYYGNKDCKTYHDYKELLGRKDIDAVSIGLPDHWHGIVSVAAAKAGKDIYGEKPL